MYHTSSSLLPSVKSNLHPVTLINLNKPSCGNIANIYKTSTVHVIHIKTGSLMMKTKRNEGRDTWLLFPSKVSGTKRSCWTFFTLGGNCITCSNTCFFMFQMYNTLERPPATKKIPNEDRRLVLGGLWNERGETIIIGTACSTHVSVHV